MRDRPRPALLPRAPTRQVVEARWVGRSSSWPTGQGAGRQARWFPAHSPPTPRTNRPRGVRWLAEGAPELRRIHDAHSLGDRRTEARRASGGLGLIAPSLGRRTPAFHARMSPLEIPVLPCTHGEPMGCRNGRLNDEWDLPTATPGGNQACRRMALFLLQPPGLPSRCPPRPPLLWREVSETSHGFLRPEEPGGWSLPRATQKLQTECASS